MRVIIAGSRSCTDIQQIEVAVAASGFKPSLIISGCARGVDRLGETWASNHGIPIEKYPANWDAYGKSAGYRRNAVMASNADVLIAVWDGHSPGTRHMIDTAIGMGLSVYIHQIS